jgi:hypothetical protein
MPAPACIRLAHGRPAKWIFLSFFSILLKCDLHHIYGKKTHPAAPQFVK